MWSRHALDAANEPLRDRSHLWCPLGGAHYLEAGRPSDPHEFQPEPAVVVADAELGVLA